MNNNAYTKEDIEPEVLKAVREMGEGTFLSDDATQRLSVVKYAVEGYYQVTFNYNWLTFKYSFPIELVEGVTA